MHAPLRLNPGIPPAMWPQFQADILRIAGVDLIAFAHQGEVVIGVRIHPCATPYRASIARVAAEAWTAGFSHRFNQDRRY